MTGRRPRKETGEIGSTRISATAAEIIHTDLPIDKEGLENFFATRFLTDFNETHPLGPTIEITNAKQNTTSNIDFDVSCAIADFMELAELNPRSEHFGRAALRDGKLNVYEYAKWIFNRIIRKKSRSYGARLSGRTILLLYSTHWQFFPSERVVECLRSHIQIHECDFAAIFLLFTNGDDLRVLSPVHPWEGLKLRKPSDYSEFTCWNLPPGRSAWNVSLK